MPKHLKHTKSSVVKKDSRQSKLESEVRQTRSKDKKGQVSKESKNIKKDYKDVNAKKPESKINTIQTRKSSIKASQDDLKSKQKLSKERQSKRNEVQPRGVELRSSKEKPQSIKKPYIEPKKARGRPRKQTISPKKTRSVTNKDNQRKVTIEKSSSPPKNKGQSPNKSCTTRNSQKDEVPMKTRSHSFGETKQILIKNNESLNNSKLRSPPLHRSGTRSVQKATKYEITNNLQKYVGQINRKSKQKPQSTKKELVQKSINQKLKEQQEQRITRSKASQSPQKQKLHISVIKESKGVSTKSKEIKKDYQVESSKIKVRNINNKSKLKSENTSIKKNTSTAKMELNTFCNQSTASNNAKDSAFSLINNEQLFKAQEGKEAHKWKRRDAGLSNLTEGFESLLFDEEELKASHPSNQPEEKVQEIEHRQPSIQVIDDDYPTRQVSQLSQDPFHPSNIFNDNFKLTLYDQTINQSDFDTLNEQIYLNDNIMNFLMTLFAQHFPRNEQSKKQVKVLNTYQFNIWYNNIESDSKHDKIKRMIKKINLSEDVNYLVIPIHREDEQHWALGIIANISMYKSDDEKSILKLPSILYLDSMLPLTKKIQQTLNYVLNICLELMTEDEFKDRKNAYYYARIMAPQQTNSYDCGIYVLEYVERFLNDPHSLLNPNIIINSDYHSVEPITIKCLKSWREEWKKNPNTTYESIQEEFNQIISGLDQDKKWEELVRDLINIKIHVNEGQFNMWFDQEIMFTKRGHLKKLIEQIRDGKCTIEKALSDYKSARNLI